MNCGGLYEAALNGNILPGSECSTIRQDFRPVCCSMPDSNQISFNSNNNNPPASSPTRNPERQQLSSGYGGSGGGSQDRGGRYLRDRTP
jgi:hypothetical protein